jgi:hypothetical protein
MAKTPEINFVKKDTALLKLHAKRMYVIQSASFVVLGVYGFILFLMLSISGFLAYQVKRVESKIRIETKALENLAPVESKYVLLKQKTSAALSMTKSLYRHQDLIEAIFQLIPSDLSVKGFSVDEANEIIFSGSTSNPQTISEFIANINKHNNIATDNKLVKANIASVNVNIDGLYTFSVNLKVEFSDEDNS